MAKLTIEFHQMFLYVTRSNAPDVVLLPSGGIKQAHNSTVSVNGKQIPLNGADVLFASWAYDGLLRIPGDASRRGPSEARLLNLRRVLGPDCWVPSGLLDEAGPRGLNARIDLPNGTTAAPPASRDGAQHVTWRLDGQGAGFELTDRLVTVVSDLPAGGLYLVIKPFGEGPQVEPMIADGDGNYEVVIRNLDAGCTGGRVEADHYTLDEYQLLYGLTNKAGARAPVPEGDYPGDKDTMAIASPDPSDCLPICGGANCPGEPRP